MTLPEYRKAVIITHSIKINFILRFDPSIESNFSFGQKYSEFLEFFFGYAKQIIENIAMTETEFEFSNKITIEIWLMNIPGKKVGRIIEDNPIIITLNYNLFVDWEKKELNNIYLHETIFHKTTLRDFLSHELHHKFDNKFKDKAWSILINEVKLEEKNRGIPFVLKYIFFNIRSEALPAIMDFPHKVKFKRNSIRSFRSRILELAKYEIDKVTVFIESSGKSEKEKLKMSLYYKAVLDDSEDDKNLNALYKKFAEDWYTSRSITHDIAIYTSFIIAYSQMDPSTVIHTSGLKVNNLVAAIDNGFIINSPSEQIIRNTYRMIKESDVLGYIKLFEGAARKLNLPNKLIPISVAIYHKLIKECVRINQEMIDCIKKEGKLVIEHHDLSLREFKDIVHQ